PECAHDSKECNAYIIGDSSMCYYNNKVYWHDSQNGVNYLYSMAPDATERQQEKVLKSEIAGNNLMVRLHRDYVYIAKIDSVVEDGASSKTIRITREPLGSITEEPELVYEESCISGGDFFIQAAGNVLYILVNTYDVETQESKVFLHGYNIESQQVMLLTEKQCQGLIVKDFRYVTGDTCYISLYDGWGSTDTVELWQWNQAINQLDVLFTEEPEISNPYLQEEYVVLLTGADNPQYCVMDYLGSIIREGKMPFPQGAERVRFTHMGGTKEYTLVSLIDWNGEGRSLLMIPFDPAEEIKILWTNV
ncbi:MAG: hypothetical protein IJ315_09595, partial [Firmicutes bacterium]|nr:hypothetical protein [Bacillota bacterium]